MPLIDNLRDAYEKLHKAYSESLEARNELNKRFNFEKIYKLIYKSQIQLLWLLTTTQNPLIWNSILKNHYPRTMRNDSFYDYMYFLKNSKLIDLNSPGDLNPNVSITQLAKKGTDLFIFHLKSRQTQSEVKE